MAVTNEDLERLRHELEVKVATVTVDQVNAATAISAYGERISGIELRVDALSNEMDRRFESQMGEIHRRFEAQTVEVNRRFDAQNEEMNRRFDAQNEEMNRRFGYVDARIARLESKLDARFGWQTVMMTALGVLILFGDTIRNLLGL